MKNVSNTQEEKLVIVEDYFDQKLTYREAAEKHSVSYHNVYSWVNQYKEHEPIGLVDGRGRGRPKEIMSEEERQEHEKKLLQKRIEELKIENEVIKKYLELSGMAELPREITSIEPDAFKEKLTVSRLADILEIHPSTYSKHNKNSQVNHKYVYRLMREMELKALIRRTPARSVGYMDNYTYQNILNRNFKINKPNHK